MSRQEIKIQKRFHRITTEHWMQVSFCLSIFLLLIALFAFQNIHFYTSLDFYKLSLAMTTVVMVGVGSISIARYAAKPNDPDLFIALAFLSHALLDTLQLFTISDYGTHHFTFTSQYSIIYWSWLASQILWVGLLCVAVSISFLQQHYGEKARVRWGVIVTTTLGLTAAAAVFFLALDLPLLYFSVGPFNRPLEFIPGILALVTLLAFFIKGEWHTDPFDFGLILGLFWIFLAHIFFASQSLALLDEHFYISHFMTNVSILFVIVGVLRSMTRLLQDVESQEHQIEDRMQEIKREKALDDTFIESIGDAIVVTDSDTRITRVNKAFQSITGWKEEEAIGQPVTKILPMLDSAGVAVPYEKRPQAKALFRGQKVETSMQSSYVRKDESHFTVSSTVTPIVVDGDIIGAIEVFRDVSKEKLIDEQKSTFVSVASHQLRTPLTTLSWYTEMLLSGDAGKVNKKQKEFLQEIYQGSKRLVLLVNDLLNISRIESGRLTIEPEPTDLKALIDDSILEVQPLLEGLKCTIKTKFPRGKMKPIPLDPVVFRQVIHNLLTNAIRYSPKDKASAITVAVNHKRFGIERNMASLLKPGSYIVVSVKDEGIGIPKNQQTRIFEKFFRADNALHAAADGSGLGLYFIKMIMEAAGGKLWFDSVEKKGSTFFVAIRDTGMKKKVGEKRISTVATTSMISHDKK
jgi:PAS domain S-box-containing protein